MIWYNDEVVWNIPRFSEVYARGIKVWQPQFATITNESGIAVNGNTILVAPTGHVYNYDVTYNVPLTITTTLLETVLVTGDYSKESLRNPSAPSYHKKSFTINIPANSGSARNFDLLIQNERSLDELAVLHFSQMSSTTVNTMTIQTVGAGSGLKVLLFSALPTTTLNVSSLVQWNIETGSVNINWYDELTINTPSGGRTNISEGDRFYVLTGTGTTTDSYAINNIPFILRNGSTIIV